MSDVTEEAFIESMQGDNELDNYDRLVNATAKKLKVLESDDDISIADSVASGKRKKADEKSDEFLRNFFIKFGLKRTLENFQQEWYELKAQK